MAYDLTELSQISWASWLSVTRAIRTRSALPLT